MGVMVTRSEPSSVIYGEPVMVAVWVLQMKPVVVIWVVPYRVTEGMREQLIAAGGTTRGVRCEV